MKALNLKLTENPVFEDNPELKAVPEFENLTERQMRYVMLVDFHGSPLRLMKPADRKFRAALISGYKMEKDGKRLDINGRNLIEGKVATIELARKTLNEIQHDGEREIMEALSTQVDEMVKFFKKPNKTVQELDKAVILMTKLPVILETKKKILEILNFRDQEFVNTTEAVESDNVKASLLDEYNDKNN